MPEHLSLVGSLFDPKTMEGHCTQTYVDKKNVAVNLVVSPTVMLVGNEDGQRYDTERVVVKAVVRVEEEDEEL